jgi:hypothetical protein
MSELIEKFAALIRGEFLLLHRAKRQEIEALKGLSDALVAQKPVSIAPSLKIEGFEMMTIKGDKGEKGDAGPEGKPGKDGTPGKAGLKGDKGDPGKDGRHGAPGRDGVDGRDGTDGVDGAPGIPGQDGSPDTGDQIVSKLEQVQRGSRLKYAWLDDAPDLSALNRHVISRDYDLAELKDVSVGTQANGQALVWNSTTQKWQPGTVASSGAAWGSISGSLYDQSDLADALDEKEFYIAPGTTSQYWRGDKSWQTLDKTAVGLGNVDNTSDDAKPVSTATQTALDLKAPLASPTFTGTLTAATIVASGSLSTGAGSVTAASIRNPSAANYGIYWPTNASMAITLAGNAKMYFTSTLIQLQVSQALTWASSGVTGAADTGIVRSTAGNVSVTNGGSTTYWRLGAAGIVAATDNTLDIGASGATRPRTGYFGTSVVAPTVNATTGFQANGVAGASGTFTTADAKTVTVTNGIITAIV